METILPDEFSWPLAALPRLVVAGLFAHRDRDFASPYRIRHLAIHLYDYAGDLRMGRRQIALRPGDLTLTPPGIETRYHLPRTGRHWCVHVQTAEQPGPRLRLPLHLRLGPAATMARERLVRVIGHHHRARGAADGSPAATAAAAAMLELLCWLAEQDGPAENAVRGDAAVAQAAELLRTRPAEAWQPAGLARQVGLSPAYLARRFRQRYGHTLARFQLVQRIGAAQALLACTDLAVGEVGRQVGLPDPHHFNKLFRRIAGQPPSTFRSSHRG